MLPWKIRKIFSAIVKTKNKKNYRDGYLLRLTLLMLIVIFVIRWSVDKQHPPLAGFLDNIVVFYLCTVLFLTIFEIYFNVRAIIIPVISSGFITMLYVFTYMNNISEKQLPAPALQSPLFIPHILFYLSGYAMMAINTCASVAYLISPKKVDPKNDASISDLDIIIRTTLSIGFTLITIGFLFGIVWARYAWGRYWGWDPKESWALIVWLFYLAVIHMTLKKHVLSKKLLFINIGAFLTILFTYFGVKFLPTATFSIHVYK